MNFALNVAPKNSWRMWVALNSLLLLRWTFLRLLKPVWWNEFRCPTPSWTHSAPKRPSDKRLRGPSDSTHFLMPWWFSSLAMILMFFPASPKISRISRTPAALRMNEAKTMSTYKQTTTKKVKNQKSKIHSKSINIQTVIWPTNNWTLPSLFFSPAGLRNDCVILGQNTFAVLSCPLKQVCLLSLQKSRGNNVSWNSLNTLEGGRPACDRLGHH